MKTSLSHPRRHGDRGWTLTELMFVMGIMVALAALVAGSIGPIKNLASREKTRAIIKTLETGLEGHKAEYGSYPVCDDVNDGAGILYRSLFGDYDENGIPDHDRTESNWSENQDVKTFVWDLQPPEIGPDGIPVGSSIKYVTVDLNGNDKYIVVDAWGNQMFYACYPKGSNEAPAGGKHNPSFDLFSIANDDTGSKEERWIKNW